MILPLGSAAAMAQLSPGAYRVLGQRDPTRNGVNMVQGAELHSPSGIALDGRSGQVHLYICDTANSRVMAWADVNAYQTGGAPALILGQPGPQNSGAYGIGVKGFNSPTGIAVNPANGDLYVADTGNSRVLHFPSPFANPTRIEPDLVYGQPNFTTFAAGAASPSTLNAPRAVAVDAAGNLWVADTGNNRVLRFAAAAPSSAAPPAATAVIGQNDYSSANANQGGGAPSAFSLSAPAGLAFDSQGNLYVSDFGNKRVLRYSAPLGSGSIGATLVLGESDFAAAGAPPQANASSMNGPAGLAVDAAGNLYAAVPNDNRVLIFAAGAGIGAGAKSVLGQSDFLTTTANTAAAPNASPNTMYAPSDVKVDSNGNVFVADTGNNRVVQIPSGSKSAAQVWGQNDFVSNGANEIKPGSIDAPYKMAIDYSQTPFALYVSDTNNHRVLVWKDSAHFQSGDPADMVIGQPNLLTAAPNVDSGAAGTPTATSLSSPTGLAVNQANGTLYVADSGNNRVLRFPRPVAQSGRITPDAVIGQPNFTSSVSAAVNAASLKTPAGLAIGPNGDLFIADSGNNRVLEFPASAGNGASALRVYGQPNMNSALRAGQPSAQTLVSPEGVFVDQAANLYVADTGDNRVVIYSNTQSAPAAGMAASFAITGADAGGFKAPLDVAGDSNGNIYISDNGKNRVLIYSSPISITGPAATGVIGQPDLKSSNPDFDAVNGAATADCLYAPLGIYVDRQDTLYVGDSGNSRVLHFLKAAAVVNAASFQSGAPVGRGALAVLGGAGLSSDTATASGANWPATLVNRQVVVNDQIQAPLFYIGPGQVNFQVPSNAPLGSQRFALRVGDTGELIAGGNVPVEDASPGLFTKAQNGAGQAVAINQDGTVNGPSNPARAGSTITLYGTGQGQVSPAVTDGSGAPVSPLANTVAVPTTDGKTCLNTQPSVCVPIGSGFGAIQYSGLAPGYIGLWQINVTIPPGTTPGNAVPLRVVIDGMLSNLVTIAVK